jgi:hypothetical protein
MEPINNNVNLSNQSNANAGGDVVGRDKNNKNIYINIPEKKTFISRLSEQYLEQKKNDITISNIVDELQHYKLPPNSDEVLEGLEKKLENGHRKNVILIAKEYKEKFTKKLLKHEYFESAQTIYAHILSEIKVNFNNYIYPQIQESTHVLSQVDINILINKYILEHIKIELEDNILDIVKEDINGMIYYLTGNCHIKWI